MATTRAFTYNTSSTIDGSIQVGDLAVATTVQDFSSNPGNARWWMGPDEDNRYIIAKDVPASNWPTQLSEGNVGNVKFWASTDTTPAFISVSNRVTNQNFSSGAQAYNWLFSNGYWTNYVTSSAAPIPVTASFSPNSPWFSAYSSYSNKVYNAYTITSTNPYTIGVWQWDGNNPTVSSSVAPLDGDLFRDSCTSPDGKKILFAISNRYEDFRNIGLYDVVNNTLIATSSLDIPGTGSIGYPFPNYIYNGISYDTNRNEFLVSGMGYTTEGLPSSSAVSYGFIRVLRFSTSSLAYQGYYYPVASGSAAPNNYPQPNSFYNPNDDCLYNISTFYSGSVVNEQTYRYISKYNISTEVNTVLYQTSTTRSAGIDPSGKNDNSWWNFSTILVPETNQIWLNNYYWLNESSSYWVGIDVYDIATNNVTSIYSTSSKSEDYRTNQMYWAYDNDKGYMYTFQNHIQVWDVQTKSLLTEISTSKAPGSVAAPIPYLCKLAANTNNTELWVAYSAAKYWDVFDMSNL
jgi:hypothetical protein